jgi:hypothetical protein
MRKTRHQFPASTVGRYRPGVGTTITKANIAIIFPFGVEDAARVVKVFNPPVPGCEQLPPSKRHLARANRLLHGGE